MGVYGGKDFWKRYVYSLEWKSTTSLYWQKCGYPRPLSLLV